MKAKSRRQFSSEFKAKVVLEVLRQDKTLNQIASEHDLHPQLIQTWKQVFMAAVPQVFDQQKGVEKPVAEETGPLYEQIGRLQMELNWLKKKLATNP